MKHGSAPGHDTTDSTLAARVHGLMPRLKANLVELVAIPSVSETGYPAASQAALLQARDAVAALFADAGCRLGRLASTCPTPRRSSPARPGSRPARRPSCCTATTTWCPRATSRCGTHRRSSRPSATARCTGAARRTRSRAAHRSPRRAARVGRPAAGRDQALHEGLRGDRQRRAHRLPGDRPEALPGGRADIGDMGLDPGRRADAHHRAARDGQCHRSRRGRSRPRSTAASTVARRPTPCSRSSGRSPRCTTTRATSRSRG